MRSGLILQCRCRPMRAGQLCGFEIGARAGEIVRMAVCCWQASRTPPKHPCIGPKSSPGGQRQGPLKAPCRPNPRARGRGVSYSATRLTRTQGFGTSVPGDGAVRAPEERRVPQDPGPASLPLPCEFFSPGPGSPPWDDDSFFFKKKV